METQKVNELEENNKVTKLVGLDNLGNTVVAEPDMVVARCCFSRGSGKGYVSVVAYAGIVQISSSKGIAVYVSLNDDNGIILGENQYYTTDEQDAIDNKKIWIGVVPGAGYISANDYTGENLTIKMCAIGIYEDAYYSI